MMQKHIEQHKPKYATLSEFGSHFGGSCMLIHSQRVCFATRFSEPLGGNPLDRLRTHLGHPWSDFVDLLQDSRRKFAPDFKDSRATNCTTHPLKTKQARINRKLYR